jgi:hypothetical protein
MSRQPVYSSEHQSWVIPLTQGVLCLVDSDTASALGSKRWHAVLISGHWYAKGNELYMHRLLINARPGMHVDHRIHYPVDDKIIDNRRANLRECSVAENRRNKRKTRGRSKFKGLTWHSHSGLWQVRIVKDRKIICLGYFHDPVEGARIYDEAAMEFHGDFALTNASLGLV